MGGKPGQAVKEEHDMVSAMRQVNYFGRRVEVMGPS